MNPEFTWVEKSTAWSKPIVRIQEAFDFFDARLFDLTKNVDWTGPSEMPVFVGNSHIECIVAMVDKLEPTFQRFLMMRVDIGQSKNPDSAVDATIRKDQLIASDILNQYRFLHQMSVDFEIPCVR